MTYRDVKKAFVILRRHGWKTLFKRVKKIDNSARRKYNKSYRTWILCNEGYDRNEKKQLDIFLKENLKISFVCPVFNPKEQHLEDMIVSFYDQSYRNWELCLADGGSKASIRRILKRHANRDSRIKLALLEQNRGIAQNTKAAIGLSSGDVIAFVDHDDAIAPNACLEIARSIQNGADFVYSDEDKFDQLGRFDPHFKPDWSPDTLRSYNYITHLMAMRRDLYEKCGGFREGFDGSQDHDLALRATRESKAIKHIPKILYHWRAHSGSVAGDGMNKPYAFEAGRKAVEALIVNSGEGFLAEDGAFPASYRARYEYSPDTLVSIIIPNKDKADMLLDCIDSIEATANGAFFELIIIENASKEQSTFSLYEELTKNKRARIIKMDTDFNYSAANNLGAKYANGEALLFLNNDIRALEAGWIQSMIEHAMRPQIGAVGAKLLFENGTVQHAGVVVGLGGWADHICAGAPESGSGLMQGNHLINVVRNVSAVTGACMMIEKEKFDEVFGFNEEFVLCGSDVEICLRLLDKGYFNVYTPYARLEHRESATRAQTEIPESDFIRSAEAYRSMWKTGDPYFSRNFDYMSKWPQIKSGSNENTQGGEMH